MLLYRAKDIAEIIENFSFRCMAGWNGISREEAPHYGLLTPAQIIAERTGKNANTVQRTMEAIRTGERIHTTPRTAEWLVVGGMGRPDLLAVLEMVEVNVIPFTRKKGVMQT